MSSVSAAIKYVNYAMRFGGDSGFLREYDLDYSGDQNIELMILRDVLSANVNCEDMTALEAAVVLLVGSFPGTDRSVSFANSTGVSVLTKIKVNEDAASQELTFNVDGATGLEEIDLFSASPLVSFSIDDFTNLSSFKLGSDGGSVTPFSFDLSNLSQLEYFDVYGVDITSLTLPSVPVLTELYLGSIGGLTSVDLSSQQSVITSFLSSDTALTSVNVGTAEVMTQCEITEAAMDATVVNAILVALDGNGLSNGSVDLSGGTSAAPTGAGATAATNLLGKSWSVTTN